MTKTITVDELAVRLLAQLFGYEEPKDRLFKEQAWELAEQLRERREAAAEAAFAASSAKVTDDGEEDAAADASWKARDRR